jgi:hypothetical protein
MNHSTHAEEVDLGLQELPPSLDLQALFPGDRLLRFHPNWFISDFQQNGTSFTASIKDYVSSEEFPLTGSFLFNKTDGELLQIQLTGPIEIGISFLTRERKLKVQFSSEGGKIDPDDPILLWVRAIKEYIRLYLNRTPVTLFFRLLMNKMFLKMDPSQRKICLMMAKITAVELLVILLIVVAYAVFVL